MPMQQAGASLCDVAISAEAESCLSLIDGSLSSVPPTSVSPLKQLSPLGLCTYHITSFYLPSPSLSSAVGEDEGTWLQDERECDTF